jgi:hypothetical protein
MPITGSDVALMQARSGLARSGATRSDYYYANLALTIAGVDRSAKVKKYTTEITDILNDQPDTARMVVFGFTPVVGQPIVIGSGSISNRVFGGAITKATSISVPKAAKEFWEISCTDTSWFLNRRLVTKQYSAQAAHLVVIDLIAVYAPDFTVANVMTSSPTLPADIAFKAERLSDAITRICKLIGWNWYPDFRQDVHFFDEETSQAPNDLTATSTSFEDLNWEPTIEQVRTRVYVEGGGGTAAAPVAVGATALPVDECSWYASGGGTVVAGSNLITYTGRSTASGPGNLTGIAASGAGSILYAIRQGDDVNLWVERNDLAAQAALAALEGGDGIHEAFVQDRRLSQAGAEARGDAELELFSTVDNAGTYESYDKFTRSGKSLAINLPARGINNEPITLQRVTRRYAAHERWKFSVSFQRVRRDFYDILRSIQQGVTGS